MTSIKEALKIIQRTIKGDQIEAAVVDVGTMMPLGKVVSDALAQLDSADVRERIAVKVQTIFADKLSIDALNMEIDGTGPASYAVADLFLSTGLLPDASLQTAYAAGATAVHNEWLAATERGEGPPRGDPDFSEAASDYAALHSTSAAGETTSSDGGGCMADFSSGDPNNLKELMAGPSVFDPPSEAADVLAMKEACKRAVLDLTKKWANPNGTQYEQGAQDHANRIVAAISRIPVPAKADAGEIDVPGKTAGDEPLPADDLEKIDWAWRDYKSVVTADDLAQELRVSVLELGGVLSCDAGKLARSLLDKYSIRSAMMTEGE